MGESYSEVAIIARMVGFVPFKIRTSAISRFLFLPPYVDPWEFENDLKEIV